MQFSWRGIVLVPLLVPAIFSGLMAAASDNNNPVLAFLFVMALGCIISYGMSQHGTPTLISAAQLKSSPT